MALSASQAAPRDLVFVTDGLVIVDAIRGCLQTCGDAEGLVFGTVQKRTVSEITDSGTTTRSEITGGKFYPHNNCVAQLLPRFTSGSR